jgi:hypothetical protein
MQQAPVVARKEAAPGGATPTAAEPAAPAVAGGEARQGPSDPAAAVRLARTGQRIELPHRAEVEAKLG